MKTEVSAPADSAPLPAGRSRGLVFVKYWLPVLLLCAIIFGFSSDSGSGQRSSRIIGPILRWLMPGIDKAAEERVVVGVRKAAHVTEYAALALLVWRARRKPARGDTRPWNWREAGFALAFAALFAASDELHQHFVPKREGKPADVLIDTVGALIGLLAMRAYGRWRGRW